MLPLRKIEVSFLDQSSSWYRMYLPKIHRYDFSNGQKATSDKDQIYRDIVTKLTNTSILTDWPSNMRVLCTQIAYNCPCLMDISITHVLPKRVEDVHGLVYIDMVVTVCPIVDRRVYA